MFVSPLFSLIHLDQYWILRIFFNDFLQPWSCWIEGILCCSLKRLLGLVRCLKRAWYVSTANTAKLGLVDICDLCQRRSKNARHSWGCSLFESEAFVHMCGRNPVGFPAAQISVFCPIGVFVVNSWKASRSPWGFGFAYLRAFNIADSWRQWFH